MKSLPSLSLWLRPALGLLGLCALLPLSSRGQSDRSTTAAGASQTSRAAADTTDGKSTPSVTSPAAGDAGIAEPTPLVHTGASTFGEETDPAVIDTPPPPPRAETKPASPDPKSAWVPGHYIPVKGEWQWVPGKWAQPPTVESVWIQGSYDAKTKRWSEGHWQPDGKPATTPPLNEKGPAPAKH